MLDNQQLKNSIDEKSIIILPFSLINNESEIHLALNVQKIAAVVEVGEFSLLPGVSAPFVYMIKMQEIPVPVLELSQLKNNIELNSFKSKTNEKRRQIKKRIIICHILSFYLGIIVDSTKKIKKICNNDILAPPDIWENSNHFFVSGLINEKDHYRYIFDIEKYISTLGINIGNISDDINESKEFLKGKKALVVEDSRVYQMLAKQFFEKYEMKMDLAKDGKHGLEMLLRKGDEYDFIITDIEMPNMNGIQMIKEYRSMNKTLTTPILFHSSISNPEFSKDLLDGGLGEMIHKFNEENLIKAVVRLFNR